MRSRRAAAPRSSRYLGVVWEKGRGQWGARITEPGPPPRMQRIALFDDEEDAAIARDRVALYMHGAAAKRNLPRRRLTPASIPQIRTELRGRAKSLTTSRFQGVSLSPPNRRQQQAYWRAFVKLPGRLVHLGYWATEPEAAVAHDRAILYYGLDRGRLNFPKLSSRLRPAGARALRAERARVRKATTSSRYRGVSWAAASACWRACIRTDGRNRHLGLYSDDREAALAYDAAAFKLHGDAATLNFPRRSRPGAKLG